MKNKMKSLLSLVLSFVMMASMIPSTVMAAEKTSVVKDYMDWPNWEGANYFEGLTYYMGNLSASNEWTHGYQGRSGGDSKYWVGDSNWVASADYQQYAAINATIYPTRGDATIPAVVPPTNGGIFGYAGHNYGQFVNADKTIVPDDKWLGVKDISAYKDDGYLVFTVERTPASVDNAFFCITAAADSKSIHPYESTGTTLPISKATHGDVTTDWRLHRMTAIRGVNIKDYYDMSKGGTQTVAIPLKKFVDEPDFEEFAGTYYDRLEELYATENYQFDLRLYSGAGIAKREVGAGECVEVRVESDTGYKIVALDDPENLNASVDGSRITLSWDSTDSDADFVVTKTVNGETEEIDAGSSTSYVDIAGEVGEYTYSVRATSSDYGIESKSSNEVTVSVESVSEVTNVIKEDIDWENWMDTSYSNKLDGVTYFVSHDDDTVLSETHSGVAQGANQYNNFQWWSAGSGRWDISLNDTGYTYNNKGDISRYTQVSNAFSDIPTSDGVLWGYKGSKYYLEDVSSYADTIPEHRWMGVMDLSEYEDNGYFIFDVKVDNASYDMDNAYLAIDIVPDKSKIGLSSSETLPATKSKYPDKLNWDRDYNSIVLGVKLTDYYDKAAMGQQRLYVPISEFTENYDLKEVAIKKKSASEDDYAATLAITPDLQLFAGMGIAKKNSSDFETDPKPFSIKVYDLQIASVQTPAGVTATLGEDGKVDVSWNATTDLDVVYNLYRKAGTTSELIYSGSGIEYQDTVTTNGVYTYYVVASHKDQTALVSKASDSAKVTFISGETTKSEIMKFHFYWDDARNGSDTNYYIGEKSGNSYGQNGTYGATLCGPYVELQVNDYGYGDGKAEIRASEYTGKKWNQQNWGYAGETFRHMSLAETPEEFWCNVYDATAIADYGYAVFEISPVVADGIDTAYLAITTPRSEWAMNAFYYNDVNSKKFTPETHPKPQNCSTYGTLIAGVKLTDYYDKAKGGRQVIAVPLKEFVESPDFLDSYGDAWANTEQIKVDENTKLDLSLLNGMGIVREDNDTVNALGFIANVYTMGIFAPQIPTGLSAEVADNGDVTLSWAPTSDTDTSYRLARTNQGKTTYIDVGKEMSYTDTGLNPGNYTYSIAAIDDTCGIVSAESEPIAVKSIGAQTDPNKYTFSFIYGGTNGEHTERSYYVGDTAGYNNWGHNKTGAVDLHSTYMNVTLNDTGYVADSTKGEIRTGDVTGKTWNNTKWGWGGLCFDVMEDFGREEGGMKPADPSKIPDYLWGDVFDLTPYQDIGYAVFKINVTNDEGINDAYFTLTAAIERSAIPAATGKGKITKENNPDIWAQQHYCTLVSGVKLTDYYDVYEGGEQVVAIPISEFIEDYDFLDSYGKAWGADSGATVTEYTKFDPSMFSGMGIAREISEDANIMPLGFSASISAMSIVNLFTPSELTAVKGEESVSLSWFETSDIGVTYRLIKSSKDGVEKIDVGTNTSYVDTDVKQGRTYSYQIVAVDAIGATSAPSQAVTADFPYVTGIKAYTGTGDSKIEAVNTVDGAMTVEFYCPGQTANGYVAVYDEDKLMTQYIPVELTGVEEWIPVEVTTTSADTLKAFLWDDEMNPLVDEVVIEPDELEVALMSAAPQIKNVIYMIPDGGGMALFDFANGVKNEGGYSCSGYGNNTEVEPGDMFMKDYLIGTIKTYCANSAITDSAAAGTALSSGYKTNGAVVGLKPDGTPRATLTEAFQLMGKKTGLVVTVEWPHATPASFAAHSSHRDNYDEIAAQMINQDLDVVLPIGFTEKVQYGTSTNKEFTNRGYNVVNTLAEIEAIKQGDRVWGGRPWYSSDMYSDANQADLAEMTAAAIRAMDGTDEGFFLMVEGSSVDGGGHQNDNLLSTSEYLAFDEAFKVAVEYAMGRNDTVVIACPDHDTGGLILPGCTDTLTGGQPDYTQYLDAVLTVCGGVKDATLSWTGDGHTARNGGLWAYVPEGIDLPVGTAAEPGDTAETRALEIENTDIAPWIADITGADLDKSTEELFVDVTSMGTYDKETQIFTFDDYDVQVKRNESYAIINGEEVDLDGQVCIRPNSKFYVPQLLFDSIRPVIREVDEVRYWDAASNKALVKGQVDKSLAGQDVTLMVTGKTDDSVVEYIDQFDVLADGSYVCWFSVDADMADYDVEVKIGTGDIATNDIVEASSLYQWLDSAYTVEIDEGVIETEVAVQNYAGLAGLSMNMIVMYYDVDGQFISCEIAEEFELAQGINYDMLDVTPPTGAVTAKFAVWSGALGAFPITSAESIALN